MNKFIGKIIARKNFNLALLVFILPFLSYLHLFFIDSDYFGELLASIDVLHIYNSYHNYFVGFIYAVLTWTSYLILIIISFESIGNKHLGIFFLFPMYLAVRKLILYLLPFSKIFGNLYVIFITIVIGIVFGLYFYKNAQRISLTYKNSLKFPIVALIALPFLNELWKLYPAETDSLYFIFIKIRPNGFLDAQTALYNYMQKISFIVPFLIYFFSEKRWYRYAFLAPIIIYSAQLYNIIFLDVSHLDEIEIYQTAKFTIPLLGILLLLAKASDHQERIKHWIESQYLEIEGIQKKKLLKRQNLINSKRRDIVGANTEVLQKIKTELEQELKSSN